MAGVFSGKAEAADAVREGEVEKLPNGAAAATRIQAERRERVRCRNAKENLLKKWIGIK